MTDATVNVPLYPLGVMPEMTTLCPTARTVAAAVVMVTTFEAQVAAVTDQDGRAGI